MKSQKDNNNDIKSIVKLGKSKLESRSGLLGGNIIMEDVEGQDPISFTVLIVSRSLRSRFDRQIAGE